MQQKKLFSIRNKLFIILITVSTIPIILATFLSLYFVYENQTNQILEYQKKSLTDVSKILTLTNQNLKNAFYRFETESAIKNEIYEWSRSGELTEGSDSILRDRIFSIISSNSAIAQVSIINLPKNLSFQTHRLESKIVAADVPNQWLNREPGLQTNYYYKIQNEQLYLIHQMNRGIISDPFALIVFQMRPSFFNEIIEGNQVSERNDTTFILNDENEILFPSSDDWPFSSSELSTLKNVGYNYVDNRVNIFEDIDNSSSIVNVTLRNELIKPAKMILRLNLTIIFVILIVVIFVSIYVSKKFTKPITSLADSLASYSVEEVPHSVSIDYPSKKNDEIGLLENSYVEMVHENNDLINRTYKTEIEKNQAQIKMLQSQINPHFLYNTLQVIGGMGIEAHSQEIYTTTLALSSLLRYSLELKEDTVTLKEEMTQLNSYLFIQNKRFNNRIHVRETIPDKVLKLKVPRFILQPIVENSLQHGLRSIENDWIISISGEINKDSVFLVVEDNGVGIRRNVEEEINNRLKAGVRNENMYNNEHIGLTNINSRLKLMYGAEAGLTVENRDSGGVRVTFRMEAVFDEV